MTVGMIGVCGNHATTGSTTISNGIQLTTAMVGPQAILSTGNTGYPGNLTVLSLPPRGFWRGDAPLEFTDNVPYVQNNLITNTGGIVPSGGMTIDGYVVPAGTYVSQYKDFSIGDINMLDASNFMFRGCRFRRAVAAPGFFNCSVGTTGSFWFFFCDAGGPTASSTGPACEVPFDIQNATMATWYRNYISWITTGIQPAINVSEVTENYIEKLSTFGNNAYHLNGITYGGGATNLLVARNNIVIWNPDDQGRGIVQTDCISLFQDFDGYTGNGTNRDGSTGYVIDNNYVGGTGYCIYGGGPGAFGAAHNVKVTNNLVTTATYTTGGFNGPFTGDPPFGSNGSFATNNRWADGASVGQLAFGSS